MLFLERKNIVIVLAHLFMDRMLIMEGPGVVKDCPWVVPLTIMKFIPEI